MNEVKIIIPWRPSDQRRPGFEWIYSYYKHRFGETGVHVELDESNGPFNRSKVINSGVSRFPGCAIAICDADVFVCDWTIRQAIKKVQLEPEKLVIPHNGVCRMSPKQSEELLKRSPRDRISGKMFPRRRTRKTPGGMWVVDSDLYLRHMMDERFVGWGAEDNEFLDRIPNRRFPGPLFHIWHPKASMEHLAKNRRLLHRIRRARKRGSK